MARIIMTDRHKDNLLQNKRQIVDNICMDDILIDLESSRTLTRRDVQDIKACRTGYEQAEWFLDILSKKPDSSYNNFITVLRSTDQEHIANLLEADNEKPNPTGLKNTTTPLVPDIQQVKSETAEKQFNSDADGESVRTCELGHGLDAASFLEKPRLLNVINQNGLVLGITVLNSELFVTRWASPHVDVYSTENFTLIRNIIIDGSSILHALLASPRYNCLYISDVGREVIHLYKISTTVLTKWSVGDKCYGLSLTSTDNVLVTLEEGKEILEYTPDGNFIREVSLDKSIGRPWHCVQLSSDRLLISHTSGSLQSVCLVDKNGSIIQSYGGHGSEDGCYNYPRYIAVDKYENILIGDYNNSKVVLLSASLSPLGYIKVPRHRVSEPCALHLDQLNHRLYIGEYTPTGNIFVLGVNDKT